VPFILENCSDNAPSAGVREARRERNESAYWDIAEVTEMNAGDEAEKVFGVTEGEKTRKRGSEVWVTVREPRER